MNLVEFYRFQSNMMSEAAARAVEDITPAEIERAIDAELIEKGLKRYSVDKTLYSTEPKYTALPNKVAYCIILDRPYHIENNICLAMIYIDNMPGVCEEIEKSFYIPGIVPLAMNDPKKEKWGQLMWEMSRRGKAKK